MKLDTQKVHHIAKLARLKLSDSEAEKFATQLTDIITWVEMLNDVDTSSVDETSQVTGLESVLRADEARSGIASRDELLECSELPKERKQVKVKTVL